MVDRVATYYRLEQPKDLPNFGPGHREMLGAVVLFSIVYNDYLGMDPGEFTHKDFIKVKSKQCKVEATYSVSPL